MLVLCAFLAGIVGVILVRTTYRTLRQVRDLKDRTRAQRIDRDMADIRAKAAMLQTKQPTPRPWPPRRPALTRTAPAPMRAPVERAWRIGQLRDLRK